MADDIDIEEHDVMESLRRRQTPAVVVKQEPVDEDYSESGYEPDSEYYQSKWAWEPQDNEPAQIKIEKPDNAESDIPFGKIILGSKPAETREESQEKAADEENEVGDEEKSYNYNMSLVLEDWRPILEASNCFCPECQTLFATVNALDAHKMIAHSFLIAMEKEASPERNKAVKSTARPNESTATCEICKFTFKGGKVCRSNLLRHYRNVHKIDPLKIKSESELKNWKICNHCNVYFPSDTALVKHLYELLPLNDKVKDEKPSPVKVQSAVKPPIDKVTPKIVRTVKPEVPTVSNVDTTPVPKPVIVKNIKQTPKQANSLILGSKINGVKVDGTTDSEAITNTRVRKCEVCDIEYSRKYYIIHMRKFHPEILLTRLNRLKKLHPINVSTNVRYKCLVCHQLFDGPSSARKHRAEKHPEMKGRKMFLKIVKTSKIQKVKVKPKVYKIKKHAQSEDNELVVSKSTLFKCNRCSVHFLTCYGACAHSRVCETSSNHRDWSCPQCQRVFKNVDKKAHDFQHQAANAKFKVYVVYLEMVVRILCECPFCYVCFEEYKFWRHIKFGCERDTGSFFCNECRLPVDMSSKTSHESKHGQGDFTKEDFIKIDFISSSKEVKVKTEPNQKDIPVPTLNRIVKSDVVQKTSNYIRDEFILHYCSTCKTYMAKKTKNHVTGECRKYTKRKNSCKICGISFIANSGSSYHLRLHRKYPQITLSDLTFIRVSDDKKIKPIPEFYACKKCHINFLTKLKRLTHECGKTKSFNCQVCQKKIDKASFKMHMKFHNYVCPGKVKAVHKSPPLQIESEVKSPSKLKSSTLPELLMKYQSLTTLWNILYVCETCDTFTDSYDKVVEHCQNHFTNMESYGVVIMKCQICNMKFDRECYRRHLELHAGSTDITRKSFKILRYDHAKLFSAEWLSFIDLPEDQKAQILSRSMYGVKGFVRMRLEQQGPPEYTLYRCKLCLKCISPEAIIHHMSLTNCLKANKLVCPSCTLTFANRTTLAQHQNIHETSHLEADSFRIVAFNDSMDAELNKKILSEYNLGEVIVTEEAPAPPDFASKYPDNVKLVKGSKFYMFYKCVDCDVCTLDAATADHVCSTAKKVCPKCRLTFASNNSSEHAKLHDEISFSDKNVFTRAFYGAREVKSADTFKNTGRPARDQNSEKKDAAKLYKCHCGLHFTSLKTIEKHYQSRNCSSLVREKCSHCYLAFDPSEIVNHLCKHHAQSQFQSFKIIIPNKKTLFKCKQCHVLFYDKRIGVAHSEKCDGVPKGIRCDACGLAFNKTSINTHRDDHKISGKEKLDCYIVENIVSNPMMDNNVLYKCKKCNIHYMEPSSARNHVTKYKHQVDQIKKCDQCSLRFTTRTLPRHVELHHNILKIDRFRIKCIPYPDEVKDKASVPKARVNKETPVRNTETHKIYRCKKCKLHFTDGQTLLKHNEDRCSKELVEYCDFCSMKFSAKNIKKHIKQHNGEETIKMDVTEENDVTKADDKIDDDGKNVTATEDEDDDRDIDLKLYRCKYCGFHFNIKKSCVAHMRLGCDQVKSPPVVCHECGVSFTKISATRHQIMHERHNYKKDDFIIIDLSDWARDNVPNDDDEKNDTVTECEENNGNDTSVNIYKCKYCVYHFNIKDTFIKHARLGCKSLKGAPVKCDECDVSFTKISFMRHKNLHEKYNLKKGDFNVIDLSETKDDVEENDESDKNTNTEDDDSPMDVDLNLYRCKFCGYHFNVKKSCLTHVFYKCAGIKGPPVKCDECDVYFTKNSACRHKAMHDKYNLKKEDFNIVHVPDSDGVVADITDFVDDSQLSNDNDSVASLDKSIPAINQDHTSKSSADLEEVSTMDTNSTVESETSQAEVSQTNAKSKVRIYKCGDCNVYFMAQRTCQKHITKHTALDPKDYIECKLCGFQFIIAALQFHIKKHHADDFKLEDVLVEEYRPSVLKNNFPGVEIYCAIDKEQSGLVSTSSDVNNVSETIDTPVVDDTYNKSETVAVDSTEIMISSNCNELSEKADALDNK